MIWNHDLEGDAPPPIDPKLLAEMAADRPSSQSSAPEPAQVRPAVTDRELDALLAPLQITPDRGPETLLSAQATALFGSELEEAFGKGFDAVNFRPAKVSLADAPSRDHLLDGLPTTLDATRLPDGSPYHLSAAELAKLNPGQIYDHYRQVLPWLQPIIEAPKPPSDDVERSGKPGEAPRVQEPVACRPPWKPLTQAWGPFNTAMLWSMWGKLLPLFADPGVEEIWVQKVPNHPTDPTPAGFLDVLSDGAHGVRIHPCLRIPEENLVTGFIQIFGATNATLYSPDHPQGNATLESPLEMDGCRLVGGVPPASIGPFAAIRIPARIRPELDTVVGAKKFGADLLEALTAPGEPLPIPKRNFIEEARKALEDNIRKGLGDATGAIEIPMLPIEALEYIGATFIAGWNPVFSGATSAAKTTILNASLCLMPPHWRTVTVEKGVAELRLPQINWVPLFTFDSKVQKIAGLDEASMLRLAMRMSPKPIPMGEIRHIEGGLFCELTQTGHESSPTTVHSGNAQEALMRGMRMVMGYAGAEGSVISEPTAREMVANAFNVVVQLLRTETMIDGRVRSVRRCVEIVEVQKSGSSFEGNLIIKLVPVFETEIDANGRPILKYRPGRSRLWDTLRSKFLFDRIPAWVEATMDGAPVQGSSA